MATKVICSNCKNKTAVIAPRYLCEHCGHPLNKRDVSGDRINVNINSSFKKENLNTFDSEKTIIESFKIPEPNISSNERVIEEKSKKSIVRTKILQKKEKVEKQGLVVGWLIVHTENKNSKSFEVKVGDNYFGTPSDGYLVEIPIEGDSYVSRSHAKIVVELDFFNRVQYKLIDDGSRRKGNGPSLNGTYINGNPNRLPSNTFIYLEDNDTIQVGETKLVFKTLESTSSRIDAKTQVEKMDYTSTVILKK